MNWFKRFYKWIKFKIFCRRHSLTIKGHYVKEYFERIANGEDVNKIAAYEEILDKIQKNVEEQLGEPVDRKYVAFITSKIYGQVNDSYDIGAE